MDTAPETVAALWAAAWRRLAASCPDLEARLATLPRAGKVAALEASAGRQAGRAIRGGQAELVEFQTRLGRWEAAVADALAACQSETTTDRRSAGEQDRT